MPQSPIETKKVLHEHEKDIYDKIFDLVNDGENSDIFNNANNDDDDNEIYNLLADDFMNIEISTIKEIYKSYTCLIHENELDICNIYDCSGITVIRKNQDLSYLS